MKKIIYTKSVPEILNPQTENKLFYTAEESANKLGVPENELFSLAQRGLLQGFYDKDTAMFKSEEVDYLAKRFSNEENKTPPHKKDVLGTILLVSWGLCAVVFFFSIFAKRLYLLEVAVPVLAFIGFVFLGFYLVRHFKENNRIELQNKQNIETENLIRQAERLQKLNERKING